MEVLDGSGSGGFADGAGAAVQQSSRGCLGWRGKHHHNGLLQPSSAQDHSPHRDNGPIRRRMTDTDGFRENPHPSSVTDVIGISNTPGHWSIEVTE
jgi:hypothetical protein